MGNSTDSIAPITDERSSLLRRSLEQGEIAGERLSQHEHNLTEIILTKWRACLIIFFFALLIFIQTANISLISTISGSVSHDIDDFTNVTWFTSAYLIAMLTTTPLAGRLCSIFMPRYYIFFSGTTMSLGLLVTAFAQSEIAFLVGRVCSGIGAGSCFTVAVIITTNNTSPKRRGFFIGLVNTGFTVGVASGAAFSGAIDSAIDWRAVFWLQSPAAIVASFGLLVAIPAHLGADPKALNKEPWTRALLRIDYAGIVSLITSIVLLLYSLSAAEIHFLPIILSFIGFTIFLLVKKYYAFEPIFPIPVLRSRGVFLTCLSMLGYMSSRWTVLFYTPVYTLAVREWSRATAGLILIPTNAGFAAGGLIVGWLHIRSESSFYLSCLLAYAAFVISLYGLSLLSTNDSPAAAYIVTTFVNGFAAGSLLNYVLMHVLYLTPTSSHSIVVSLVALFRGIGGSMSSSIGGGIFLRALKKSLDAGFKKEGLSDKDDLVQRLLGSPALVTTLVGVEHNVAKSAYEEAVRSLFAAGCTLVIVMILLQAGTGWKTARIDGQEEDAAGGYVDSRQ